MSRIQISLPDAAVGQLRVIAATTGEPTSRVASRLLLSALAGDSVVRRPSIPVPVPEAPKSPPRRRRPVWLEPLDDDDLRIWREEMWGSILALHCRYPLALGRLVEDWWRDSQLVETLCAMAAWRADIDAASEDPREELAFQNQLTHFSNMLDRLPLGADKGRFKDGPAPDAWMRGRRSGSL